MPPMMTSGISFVGEADCSVAMRTVLIKGFEFSEKGWARMRDGCSRFIVETREPFDRRGMVSIVRDSQVFNRSDPFAQWRLESAPRLQNIIVMFFSSVDGCRHQVLVCKLM